ncbi:hypothetical protein OSB04_019532 [Centaurea solstitialis]|uniref:Transposase n=1 Tax=Centaurea solstitialis TaxID=347529 RepID=A0AA38SQI5_9ASTR|nr:hypothetical protein OSB04_019532 [Centaurea solstitialis]
MANQRQRSSSPIDPEADRALIAPEDIVRILQNNEYVNLSSVRVQHTIVREILRAHPLAYAVTATAEVPGIYLQQFWKTAVLDTRFVYISDLGDVDGPGVPLLEDLAYMRRLVGFLQHFYLLTLRVSGTRYTNSNTFIVSISCILSVLKECGANEDEQLRKMAFKMRGKFDKYWGDITKFNLLYFDLCDKALSELFDEYKRIHSDSSSKNESASPYVSQFDTSFETGLFGNNSDAISILREKRIAEVKRMRVKSGEANYLNSAEFSVLDWWKKRSPYFPILSLLARDILAIPISTVASESTFSTEGRVLDSFRSSLNPTTVCFVMYRFVSESILLTVSSLKLVSSKSVDFGSRNFVSKIDITLSGESLNRDSRFGLPESVVLGHLKWVSPPVFQVKSDWSQPQRHENHRVSGSPHRASCSLALTVSIKREAM